LLFFFFFFFQAEDGIRDLTVTGVQTCALPIYGKSQAVRFGDIGTSRLTRIFLATLRETAMTPCPNLTELQWIRRISLVRIPANRPSAIHGSQCGETCSSSNAASPGVQVLTSWPALILLTFSASDW